MTIHIEIKNIAELIKSFLSSLRFLKNTLQKIRIRQKTHIQTQTGKA